MKVANRAAVPVPTPKPEPVGNKPSEATPRSTKPVDAFEAQAVRTPRRAASEAPLQGDAGAPAKDPDPLGNFEIQDLMMEANNVAKNLSEKKQIRAATRAFDK